MIISIEQTDNGISICKYCPQDRPSKFGAKTATSTMFRHFQTKHPDTYTEMQQRGLRVRSNTPYTQLSRQRRDEIDRSFLRWIVIDQQSFMVTENSAFQLFLSKLNLQYRLPCRQTLSKSVKDEF
ncbi:27797_t:CDS:1, partial [Dentiscutata erythropus]